MALFAPSKEDLAENLQLLPQHNQLYRSDAGPISVSIAVQTDFRETAVQTDPWSAPLTADVDVMENAELKSLAELTFANGLLPAHQGTMDVIRRIEEDRDFEARIPPPMDPTKVPTAEDVKQEETRVQMLLEKDLKEWARREKDIQTQHERRIVLLVEKLAEREQAAQDLRTDRLRQINQAQMQKLEERAALLTQKAVMELKKACNALTVKTNARNALAAANVNSDRLIKRSLTGAPQMGLPQQQSTRKLVRNAVFGANQLNAPVLKPGEAPYRFSGVIRLAGTELKKDEEFAEILQFAGTNQSSALTKVGQTPKKLAYVVGKDTDYLPYRMVEHQLKGGKTLRILPPPDTRPEWLKSKVRPVEKQQLLQQQTQKTVKISTGVNDHPWKQFEQPPDIKESARQDAVLFLQNLLRGRATQLKLQQGKDRRIGLVNELRLAHELVNTRSSDQNVQKLAQDRLRLVQEAALTGVISQGVASTIGQSLDQIQKQRDRETQLNRTRAILQIAMRERARREQRETQQRQTEVVNRARATYNRQLIHQAHREFVDMVIDSLSKKSAEEDSRRQAEDLALRQVEALVELDYEKSKLGARNGYQEQLQNFLQEFLLPEVDRKTQMLKIEREQEKWLLAGNVGKEIVGVVADHPDGKVDVSIGDDGQLNVSPAPQ